MNTETKSTVETAEAKPDCAPRTCSASDVNNPHIIVGAGCRCICGVYNGEAIGCKTVIESLNELVRMANINGSGVHLYAADILKLEKVIRPLIQNCN
jgi:hypothetical protein